MGGVFDCLVWLVHQCRCQCLTGPLQCEMPRRDGSESARELDSRLHARFSRATERITFT